MEAHWELAQAVIATAVKDLVRVHKADAEGAYHAPRHRADAEGAYQFLCGAGDDNRLMLEFWCFVAGYTPGRVMSTARITLHPPLTMARTSWERWHGTVGLR